MITRGNYEERINQFGVENLNETLRSTHEWYLEVKEFYEEDKDIKDTIDLYFRKLEKFIIDNPNVKAKTPTEEKKTESSSSENRGKIKRKNSDSSRSRESRSKNDRQEVSLVENIEDEVKIIRRYVGLHDKKKDANAILNIIKALQRSVVEKRIGKKSKYADEIRTIQNNLVKVYNGMGKQIHITINDKDLSRLVSIAGGEKVYPSIAFMKRYIGMQGKKIDKEKIERFIEQVEKAYKSGRVSEEDPYEGKVNAIAKSLKNFASGKDEYLNIASAELNGLEGLISACGCKEIGVIYDKKVRKVKVRPCRKRTFTDAKGKGACSHNKGLSGIMTAEQIASQKFELLPFSGQWLELVGKPEKNFTMMLHGEPGAGKTTFILKFVQYLTKFGNVLYVSSEEFGSATLASKVKELLNPIPSNLHFASDIAKGSLPAYDFIVLDSVNDLGLDIESFKELKASNPKAAFILVLQHTKQGQFKGGKEWEHEAQIAGVVTDGVISIYKNRYGIKSDLNFFE